MSVDPRLKRIIQSAYGHGGESEPEMATGDLELAFRMAWGFLNNKQKQTLHDELFTKTTDWSEHAWHIKVED